MVTQVEIARRIGLDVSSVNKILNKTPGPVFSKETIAKVFSVARRMGYDFKRETRPSLKRRVESLEEVLRDLINDIETDGGVDTSAWPLLDEAKKLLGMPVEKSA
jgi:DNA-binding LacI/PurR family transcriptional regulator